MQQHQHPIETIHQSVSIQDLVFAQRASREIYVDNGIKEYIINIVNATRNHPEVYLGSSPRGSLALFRTSQTRAAMAGREYVIPDDVKALAEVTLAHRLIMHHESITASRTIINDILKNTPVPGTTTQG